MIKVMDEIAIDLLTENPESKKIYDHTPPPDLVYSIKDNGVLQPIWITRECKIISGHRRVNACKRLGILTIPFETKEDSLLLVIEANRYRDKSSLEKLNEVEAGKKIFRQKAKEQQIIRKGNQPGASLVNLPKLKPIDTREEAAKLVGISGKTLDMMEVIKEKNPEAFQKIDKKESTVHREYKKIKIAEKKKKYKEKVEKETKEIKGKYHTIILDPPWPSDKFLRDCRPNQDTLDYHQMTLQEIEAINIKNISFDDSFIFLWTTEKFLPISFDLIKLWGFKYYFTMVWHKNGGPQPYEMPQFNCEFIVCGKKGNIQFLNCKNFFTCFDGKRREHSRKPDEFYELVKRVSPEPRIDYFSREKRDGFEQYGNEKDKFSGELNAKLGTRQGVV